MPIADELEKVEKLLPFTPLIKLLAIVRALVAVPVPIVIPRPPNPLVTVVDTLVILLAVTVDETNPVSRDIPTGVYAPDV